MRKFPRTEPRQKGWPKWAKRIYNASCGCRMFALAKDSPSQDAHPVRFLVHCGGKDDLRHRYASYTEIT